MATVQAFYTHFENSLEIIYRNCSDNLNIFSSEPNRKKIHLPRYIDDNKIIILMQFNAQYVGEFLVIYKIIYYLIRSCWQFDGFR